jgi:ribosomal protein L24E
VELTEGSEMSANRNLTLGKYPKNIQWTRQIYKSTLGVSKEMICPHSCLER